MTPQSVLLLTTELGLGGAEHIVYDLATGLDRTRFAPVVAALRGEGPYRERLAHAGIPVYDLGLRRAVHVPSAVMKLRAVVARHATALVHAHLFHADMLARLAVPRSVPIVATTHIAEARPLPWRFRLDRWTGFRCVCRTAVSCAAARFHESKLGLPAGAIMAIPNGVDLTVFRPSDDRRAAKAALGLDPDRIVIGAFGRFDPQKGLDLFLEAAALAGATNPSIQWVLAGYGAEEARYRERIARPDCAGRVHCITHPPSARSIYTALDIYAFPSRYEGFGLTLVEAMACGCAPVASDIPTSRDILCAPPDADAGILLADPSPRRLADTLLALAADPERQHAIAHQAITRAHAFSLPVMIQAYEDLYARILIPR